jgi:hypothetical protein
MRRSMMCTQGRPVATGAARRLLCRASRDASRDAEAGEELGEAGDPEPFIPFRAERVTAGLNRSFRNLTILLILLTFFTVVMYW